MNREDAEDIVNMYGIVDGETIRVKRGDERRWNNGRFWEAANELLQSYNYDFVSE